MSAASVRAQHSDWLSALDGDGPWLTVPALTQGLEAGLTPSTPNQNQILRRAWTAHTTAAPARAAEAQHTWIRAIVEDLLGWGNHADFTHADRWAHTDPVHGITTTPDFALLPEAAEQAAEDVTPVVLGFTYPAGTPLTKRVGDGWATTRIDRAAHTLRAADVPLGLITDGRWWALLWAPRPKDGAAATPGYGLWSADLLLDDDLLRSAFTTLLSRHRSLAVAGPKTLRGLFEKSAESQEDITENLSIQTRRAVELLVDAFSTANNRAGGVYLDGVDADHVYQGAVTIVMRLIFTLAAEERRLLPGDDDFYSKTYGIATLADRIINRGNLDGEDLLADAYTAFPQVLATTRVIHDGIHHNRINIPGYGGSVFDPQRFPWLEGAQGTAGLGPIGVDDRTMLHILRGLTRWDGRRLSYRTLDVEQIGYAYEGLLDHTAVLATSPVLGLAGKKEPEVSLDDLEAAAARGHDHLVKWLKDLTGDSPTLINKRLNAGRTPTLDASSHQRLVSACGGDTQLANRVAPWLPLLRTDGRTALPLVINTGTIYVTASSARGDTGTHYTPKALAEDVVKTTLDALVYSPGPLDTNDEKAWRLVDPDMIIDLKVADIAMGSGAFLVAAIRYLAERLLEALDLANRDDLTSPALQEAWDLAHRDLAKAAWDESRDDETVLAARALVAARCIYGVDINPMAVEMAKLSIWLVTASRNKPFSFLDHRLKAGDSLLGIHDIRQLENLHLDPARGAEIYGGGENKLLDFTTGIRSAIARVSELHRQIEKKRVLDTHDVDEQASLLSDAIAISGDLVRIADGLSAASLAAGKDRGKVLDAKIGVVQNYAERLLARGLESDVEASRSDLRRLADSWLGLDSIDDSFPRRPFHWALDFPEVVRDGEWGFDAIIGNPPFLGGKKISGAMGLTYGLHLTYGIAGGDKASADLVAFMVRRAASLANGAGQLGLVSTNTLTETGTKRVGLDPLVGASWTMRAARSARPWPSKGASLSFVTIHLSRAPLRGGSARLDDAPVAGITTTLDATGSTVGDPYPLIETVGRSFIPYFPWGEGFTVGTEEAKRLMDQDPRNREHLQPYLVADVFVNDPGMAPDRWIINFFDLELSEAALFPALLERVRLLVKPERDRANRPAVRDRWWRFAETRPGMRQALSGYSRVLARPITSAHNAWGFVSTDIAIDQTLPVYLYDGYGDFALYQSGIHAAWWVRWGPTLGSAPRYTTTSVFRTFPRPSGGTGGLDGLGESMYSHRAEVLLTRRIGLTQFYNLVAGGDSSADIALARDLMAQCEVQAIAAYGLPSHLFDCWTAGVGYQEPARSVILDHVLALNHERHAAALDAGLVDASGKPLKKRTDIKYATPKGNSAEGQFGMFEMEGP